MATPEELGNGAYSRRRIDELIDDRFEAIERDVHYVRREVATVKADVARLSTRVAVIGALIGVASFVFNLIGPVLASKWLGAP